MILVMFGQTETEYSDSLNHCTLQAINNDQMEEQYDYQKIAGADKKIIRIHSTFSADDKYSLENSFNTSTRKLDDRMMQQPTPRHFSEKADIGIIKDPCTECQFFRYHSPQFKKFHVIYNCQTRIDISDPETEKWVKEKIKWGTKK